MTALGRFSASKIGISESVLSAMESRCLAARPPSFSWMGLSVSLIAGCSSVFMTGIRGATPPPAD
jgi:Na+-transporting NADH:ubiquinone oxidoreductase subunit NqrD